MATRQQPDRKAKYKETPSTGSVILKPTDAAWETDKLASGANHWGKNELNLLRVSYPLSRTVNLNNVLRGIDESQWPQEMRQCKHCF